MTRIIFSKHSNLVQRAGLFRSLFAATALLATGPSLFAQAAAGGFRPLSFSTFATGGLTNTDYGRTDNGISFGTDLRYSSRLVQPSLELRSTFTSGDAVREHTYDGGLKLERGFGKVRPYGDFLFGYGVISFPKNKVYASDNSSVWTYGGGLEYQVTPSFLLRADAQMQSWRLDPAHPSFNPTLVGVGFTYRPTFRNVVR